MEEENQKLKPADVSLTKTVMWLVRSHWLWVFVIIGIQYVSGQVLGDNWPMIAPLFSYPAWRQIHSVNSNVIIGSVGIMLLVKAFLWLRRNGWI